VDFAVEGSEDLDTGAQVNDDLPMNTAFFVVTAHPGFNPFGRGSILDGYF